jgi:hypothetical protein
MSDALVFTGIREGGLEFIWGNGVYVRDRYVGLIYPVVRSKLVFGLPNNFNNKGQCPKASQELGGARSTTKDLAYKKCSEDWQIGSTFV